MAKPVIVSISEPKQLEKVLARFSLDLREKKLGQAIRRAGNVVKKEAVRLCPKPGYTGDKPGLTPLKDTMHVKVVKYRNGNSLAMIGPRRPDGAHGHLVEFGHTKVLWGNRTTERVPPHPFLRPAADATVAAQQAAIIGYLKQQLASMVRG